MFIGAGALCMAGLLTACTSARFSDHPPPPVAGASDDGRAAKLAPPQRLLARGTEPFWLVEVERERLLWKTPEQPEGRWLSAERHVGARSARYSGHDGATAFALEITAAPCSDGMSDLAYPFTAVWFYGAATQRGCALPRD
ncbi:COG3650 family protein [Lysobacter korlensis]|uniref:COG3650 family protein n=1 Tax=Lysobacter korlensis TaxID=553636 RepID=A0ABV6RK18_9GAMM